MTSKYSDEYSTLASIFSDGWKVEVEIEVDGEKVEEEVPFSDVQYENLPYSPETEKKWVRFSVNSGAATMSSIGAPGNNLYRYTGVVQVQCFAPALTGVSIAKDMADKAIEIFHDSSCDGFIFLPGYAQTIHSGSRNGWYQVNATIPFIRECLK